METAGLLSLQFCQASLPRTRRRSAGCRSTVNRELYDVRWLARQECDRVPFMGFVERGSDFQSDLWLRTLRHVESTTRMLAVQESE